MKLYTSISVTIVLGSLASSIAAFASHDIKKDMLGKSLKENNITQYWTAERLKNAKEMPMPIVDLNAVKKMPSNQTSNQKSKSGDGALPDKTFNLNALQLLDTNNGDDILGGETGDKPDEDSPIPNNNGTFNQYFTSSRLVPLTADTTYPYRTVGKLFF